MVALEHFSSSLVGKLFALAAQSANSIGIHQWHCFHDQLGDESVRERRNISYCLYILDKVVCWTTGTPPSIPISDVHIEKSLTSCNDSTTAYFFAKLELAAIEEIIYSEIYGCQAGAKNEEEVRQLLSKIMGKLQGWLADSEIDLDNIENDPKSSPLKVELALDFLCAQLLLIWPYKSHPDITTHQCTDNVKRYMRLMLQLWCMLSNSDSYIALPRSVFRVLYFTPQ